MIRGTIFDMDGTIFDTERFYLKAWIETADLFGVERHPTLGLAMGRRVLSVGLASETVRVWLTTDFTGGRHVRRIEKISALEK